MPQASNVCFGFAASTSQTTTSVYVVVASSLLSADHESDVVALPVSVLMALPVSASQR